MNRFSFHADMTRAVASQRRKHGLYCLDCSTTERLLVEYLQAYELALDLNQSRESRELWTERALHWHEQIKQSFFNRAHLAREWHDTP